MKNWYRFVMNNSDLEYVYTYLSEFWIATVLTSNTDMTLHYMAQLPTSEIGLICITFTDGLSVMSSIYRYLCMYID